MALDFSSLRKAVDSLERAIKVASSIVEGSVDKDQQNVIRAGVIQNFELTYELCWKFMKRWLSENVSGGVADGLTRKELFRLAAESRLIGDPETWFDYHEARNETARTYDRNNAEEVYKAAINFAKDARGLLQTLESKND